MIYGIESMTDIRWLPVKKQGIRTHYEGSIDKAGGNADWDWWLYQDERGEWVLFDYDGAGCLYNFVQHRYPDSVEPTFRFYFDGESIPRFIIKHSQFGEVYPFLEPLASRYIGPNDNGRGPIRVVRSFVPMPFAKSCKITSDIKLEGYDRTKGHGGWGHVIWQAYSEADAIQTFSVDDDYSMLTALWKNTGSLPLCWKKSGTETISNTPFILGIGESRTIYITDAAGCIAGLHFQTRNFKQSHLASLSIRAFWDGHTVPDVDASFGCLFLNELGYHSVRYLLAGMSTDGCYYNYYPMPFHKGAVLTITNNGSEPVRFDYAAVTLSQDKDGFYREHDFNCFRTGTYYTRRHTEGADSMIADITGSGHIVGSIITGFAETPETYASCEGDVRIHFNNIRTPQIESDGSESYCCYGWGYPTPPECNPASGYDGYNHRNFSMARTLMGDFYPFSSGVRFGIESGGNNDSYLEHSGMVFYYGCDEVKAVEIGEICIGDAGSEAVFGYHSLADAPIKTLTGFFEGDDDRIELTMSGRYGIGSVFKIPLPADIYSVVLRRVSDQAKGRQRARVFVDNIPVTEYHWYFPDRNPIKRWLEDEFVIPSRYLADKTVIIVRIVPEAVDGETTFNEFGYRIFGILK